MAFAAPSEWGGMPIPALDSVSEGLFEGLNGSIILTGKGATLNDTLDRLSHVEPRASRRRPEQEDAMLGTPLHQALAFMSGQIVQDEQHAHRREKTVQLLGSW